jgi:enoyl-CoA hydratase/carnithine racemase
MTADKVRFEVRDGVGWITIDRPEAKNALTKAMYAAIRDHARRAYVDDSVYAVVVSGTGGSFAVGGDLKELLAALESDDPAEILVYEEYLPFEAVRSLPKPTVAVADGLCLGGGLTLLLMCDISIVSSRSTFAMPEATVGIVDAHLPRLLRDRVPPAWLRYWLYTGTHFSAEAAHAAGLVTMVVPDEQLQSTTEKVLNELRASSPAAIRLYKQVLNETRQLSGMQDANATLLGEDARTRLRAFSERSRARTGAASPDA